MPGTVTEAKLTPWTVAEQLVEERIKLKQSTSSRIALALRNAKIHRPALYLSAKKSFDEAIERTAINNPGKNGSKTKTNIAKCKQKHFSEIEKNSSRIAYQSCTNDSVGKAFIRIKN